MSEENVLKIVQLPMQKMEVEGSYDRGTEITLLIKARVKSLKEDEDRKGNALRVHGLIVEDCQVTKISTPDELLADAEDELAYMLAVLESDDAPEEDYYEDFPDPDYE